ncbi:MAG: GTPase [Sulfolobales archaeon]
MSFCLSRRVRSVRISEFEVLRESVLEVYSNIASPTPAPRKPYERTRTIYLSKIKRAFEKYQELLSGCLELPSIDDMHDFYKDLIRGFYGDQYSETLDRCRRVLVLSKKIYREYRERIIKASSPEEMRRLSREFIGRILSLARRKLKNLDLLKKIVVEISRMPCIEEETMKIILTGMPQTGKSTLLSVLSRARPEISNYPFTTKNIIAGHYLNEKLGVRIMFLDTPGLLDRPIDEMNEIELKAVYSLKNLADGVVFLVDPRRNFYYTLDQQLRVLDMVREIIREKMILVCINKIDIASEEEILETERRIIERGVERDLIFRISALRKIGLEELINTILTRLRS